MKLQERAGIDPALLHASARELHDLLGGPCLFHLPGRRPGPLFVSVLLHGNETSGWEAVRLLIGNYLCKDAKLPRALSLFVGNTQAAALGVRHLPNQSDYNRVWPGSDLPRREEHGLMQQVVSSMARREVFASIDIHNNTGINPHYACINRLWREDLVLAGLFGRILVYFQRPLGVQSLAMGQLCPAVTLECGKVGQQQGVDHAMEYLDACLHVHNFSAGTHSLEGLELYHTVAVVRVPKKVSVGLNDPDADLNLTPDLDLCNFRQMPAGWCLARYRSSTSLPLQVEDESGRDVFSRYFVCRNGQLLTKTTVMPSMLTADLSVIRKDCLCYLMESFDLSTQAMLSRTSPPRPAETTPGPAGR